MILTRDDFARHRLRRMLVSLEGALTRFETQGAQEDVELNSTRLRRLCNDIRTALELAHHSAPLLRDELLVAGYRDSFEPGVHAKRSQ
jgi:hypothetical protein